MAKIRYVMELLYDTNAENVHLLKVSDRISYQSSRSFLDFLTAMSDVAEQKVINNLMASEAITILVDESTDRSNKKRLAICVRTVCVCVFLHQLNVYLKMTYAKIRWWSI